MGIQTLLFGVKPDAKGVVASPFDSEVRVWRLTDKDRRSPSFTPVDVEATKRAFVVLAYPILSVVNSN
jgi:hypothetical protein